MEIYNENFLKQYLFFGTGKTNTFAYKMIAHKHLY